MIGGYHDDYYAQQKLRSLWPITHLLSICGEKKVNKNLIRFHWVSRSGLCRILKGSLKCKFSSKCIEYSPTKLDDGDRNLFATVFPCHCGTGLLWSWVRICGVGWAGVALHYCSDYTGTNDVSSELTGRKAETASLALLRAWASNDTKTKLF